MPTLLTPPGSLPHLWALTSIPLSSLLGHLSFPDTAKLLLAPGAFAEVFFLP